MFTGASNAHVAVLLVDARAGVLRQTRRHARIAKLLGIKHFVATVNKIDLVDFDQARFAEVEGELRQVAARLGGVDIDRDPDRGQTRRQRRAPLRPHALVRGPDAAGVPGRRRTVGAATGGGQAAAARPVGVAADRRAAPPLHRSARRRARCSVGDPVVSLPAGTRSTVTVVDTLDDDRTTAVAPLSVSIELADDIDVGRGDVFVSGADDATLPVLARELDATVCWFIDTPLRAGDRLALKQGTRTVRATVQALHTRLDPETLDELDNPVELVLNDIGSVTLRTSSIVVADAYADNRDSGAFILIDETTNDTVGAGTIIEPREVKPGVQTRNDIRWHPSSLDRDHRWAATGQRGATIWFTGLPASGKSTIAVAVERALVESGQVAYLLDGDNIRHGLSDDLGFSAGDRAENIRRVGHLTRLLRRRRGGRVGLAGVAAEVRPRDRPRAERRGQAAVHRGLRRHARCDECERRDPKGLYARARAGELKGLTGVDAPYEPPENADLVLDTTSADIDELVAQVIDAAQRAPSASLSHHEYPAEREERPAVGPRRVRRRPAAGSAPAETAATVRR